MEEDFLQTISCATSIVIIIFLMVVVEDKKKANKNNHQDEYLSLNGTIGIEQDNQDHN